LTADRQELGSEPIRIDLRRSLKALLLTLVIPMTLAVAADLTSGTLPFLTIAAVIICIPLATVVVSRTVLAEFDKVVALVAPPEPDESPVPLETPAESVDFPPDRPAGSTPDSVTDTPANSVAGSTAGSTVNGALNRPAGSMPDGTPDSASTGSISNDWPLDGQPFTEGAQKHHG
jgi:hypothetical protein